MMVTLRKHIPMLGKTGDVLKVSDAYARNYLLPQGLAVIATPAVIAARQAAVAAAQRRGVAANKDRDRAVQQLAGKHLTISAEASAAGRLFAGLKTAAILEQLAKQYGVHLTDVTVIPDHFKTLGDHPASVHWSNGATVDFIVSVTRG